MSAFAVLFERTNTLLEPGLLDRLMERLNHRGPDGRDEFVSDRLAMGHWQFWTTPEEVGERQPLKLVDLPFRIVLDGRLDNRSELLSRLDLPASSSDAILILRAYARWGESCFEHFVGEYAVVIHDESRDQLVCARDALGDRTLFYSFHGSRVIIASEPWAVAASQQNVELDEFGLTCYFAFQASANGETFFKNIYELLPAQVMVISSSSERRHFSWEPDPTKRTRFKRDEEYAEQFLALFEQSINARLRSAAPVGVMMSGGLDSTSVACLAARMTAPVPLKTVSFTFNEDELRSCDEQIYINAVQKQWGTHSVQIPCDDAWSYKDLNDLPHIPNRPDGNVFRLIKERVYQRAHDEGLRVLLTGEGGDHLYAGGGEWLSDLWMDGRWFDSVKSLILQAQRKGWRNVWLAGHIPRAMRTLLKSVLPASVVSSLRSRPVPPVWLSGQAADLWQPPTSRFHHAALERHENLLAMQTAVGVSLEIHPANKHGIELRHPYRDRRLIEYILTLPSYQLYYGGLYKHILRVAMKGILPEIIRTRPRPTALLPLYQRGLQREALKIQENLRNPRSIWPQFVKSDWLYENVKVELPVELVGTESMIAWLCVSFESWYKCATSEIVDRSIIYDSGKYD